MVNQTQVNGSRMGAVRHNLAGLAHDAITLTELQCQLLAIDLRDMRRAGISAGMQIVAGAVLALACLPILLIALSQCLVEFADWTNTAAYSVVGAGTLAIAIVLLWMGARMFSNSLKSMERSREEFAETLRWLKSSLRAEERTAVPPAPELSWRQN